MDSETARDEATFNIGAVAQLTGVKPETIRSWERRYGLPEPRRSAAGHRRYRRDDIAVINWLEKQRRQGLSISTAVDQWRARAGDSSSVPADATEAPHARAGDGTRLAALRAAWLSACLDFDRQRADRVASDAFAQFSPERVCLDIFQPTIAELGRRWASGEITVQQEHFASALTVRKLEALLAAAPPPSRPELIVLGCAPGDQHVFGPMLLTFLLRRRGWEVVYLGANVPAHEYGATVERIKPHLVIVSAQRLASAGALLDVARVLEDEEVLLGYGGRVFVEVPALQSHIPGHFLGNSLATVPERVESLLAETPPATATAAGDGAAAVHHFTVRHALVEAHVWGTMLAQGYPLDRLAEINDQMFGAILGALKLGSLTQLPADREWFDHLLVGLMASPEMLAAYLRAYYEAAVIHLSGPAQVVVVWLAEAVQKG